MSFKLQKKSKRSKARLGLLKTRRGNIKTPFFMPIATKGAVKALTSDEMRALGAQIILSNTYHQLLRPGLRVLKKAGGLHKFMDWDGPILTDSGGFQVFSLAKIRKILPAGVKFRSHIDGREFLLTPEKALQIQEVIGSDIRMVLDVCVSYYCSKKEAREAVDLTSKWARESHDVIARERKRPKQSLYFAIIQGSVYKDLRLQSARDLIKLNFDGYAIGGLAVGEGEKEMYEVLDYTIPELPEDKPRYLMGTGYPEQIIKSVKKGIDMFDCVIPTREARHGRLYLWHQNSLPPASPAGGLPGGGLGRRPSIALAKEGWGLRRRVDLSKRNFYRTIQITNAKFSRDLTPINPASKMPELRQYSKAYLHHLFRTEEPLALRLATLNNVEFYLDLMRQIRLGIRNGHI